MCKEKKVVHMVVDQKNELTCLRLRKCNWPLAQLLSAQAIGAGGLAFDSRTGPIGRAILGRFNPFYQIGPRTLKGPRASRGPLLYYVAQNRGKCHKLNQCLIWTISSVS